MVMVNGTEKGDKKNDLNKNTEDIFDRKRKFIETCSIIALLILISAVLLISFNQKLLAGCMVIAGASLV